MAKPTIHVAFFGNSKDIEHLTVRRCIDELIIIYDLMHEEAVNKLINKYSDFGISIVSVNVIPDDFTNILSSSLNALDSQKLDQYDIEISISTDSCIMTLAACICAAIIKASIIYVQSGEIFNISEIWPSELVNLSYQKREILSYLEGCEKPVHQKEVAGETGILQSGLSRHLRDLEVAGHVTRSRMSRCKHVSITELGRAVLHHKQIRKRRIWNSYSLPMTDKIQMTG